MKLRDLGQIHSGYISRSKIESSADGSHYLVQAKNVDGDNLTCVTKAMIKFHPSLSRTDLLLKKDDLLFMARGVHNFTVRLESLPGPALAAACFFIVRVSGSDIAPGYLGWYLNQDPVTRYLVQYSGRGVHMPVVRRAVLENIEVPLPPLDVQTGIAEINLLMARELSLLRRLGLKRKELITAACLKALRQF